MKTDSMHIVERNLSRYFKRLRQIWQKAVEPPPSIKEPENRQRARLFNGLLVMIIPTMVFVLLIQLWESPTLVILNSPIFRSIGIGIVVVVVMYVLNRLIPSYRWMAYTAMIFGFISITSVALTSDSPHIEILFLIFLPLVSTILFSLWETWLLCFITLILMAIFGLIMPDLPREILKNMIVFTALAQVFIIFVASQRNRLEQDRQQLALEEARSDLHKRLISNLSHDFRTPLSIINVNAYLAERIQDRAQQKEKIEAIVDQTMRLNKLLDDILAISRLEYAAESTWELLEINVLLSQVIDHFKLAAANKQLRMTSELAPNMPPVHANRDDLYRAFASIIENAVDYTPSGGSITVRTQFTPDLAVTEVIDTGIGIDAADLPLIFDLFFRGDRARSMDTGVSGLGLTIAKRVVELHRGSITVESVPAQGSTFRISLPRSISSKISA